MNILTCPTQPDIIHIKLKVTQRTIRIQRKHDLLYPIILTGNSGKAKPFNRVFKLGGSAALFDAFILKFSVFLCQLRAYIFIYNTRFGNLALTVVFAHIILIGLQNRLLNNTDKLRIVILAVFLNCLRHTADKQVFLIVIQCSFVKSAVQRRIIFIALSDQFNQPIFSPCHQVFLKVKRIKRHKLNFPNRERKVPAIDRNTKQRAKRNDVVPIRLLVKILQ